MHYDICFIIFLYDIEKIEIHKPRKHMQDVDENTYTRHFEKTFRHILIDKENINTHECENIKYTKMYRHCHSQRNQRKSVNV